MASDDWLWGGDREGTERKLRGGEPKKYTWGNAGSAPAEDKRGRPSDGTTFSFWGPDQKRHTADHGDIWYGKVRDDRGRRRHVYARASDDHVEVHDEPAWWDLGANQVERGRQAYARHKVRKWQRIADGEPSVGEEVAESIGDGVRMAGGAARNTAGIIASILFGRRHF